MKVRIWGVRGSLPSPLKPSEIREKMYQAVLGSAGIDTTDPQAVRRYIDGMPPLLSGTAGGNTTCVEVQADAQTFIIDAGSGLRQLGLELMKGPCGRGQGVLHLFFSHAHWDHIQGFPFFVPAFVPGNRLIFYSVHDFEAILNAQQNFINFPISVSYMQSTKEFVHIEPGQVITIGNVKVSVAELVHPNRAFTYRFDDQYSSFVFSCDGEYKSLDAESLRPYVDFYRNADTMLFDAQYTLREAWQKVDWGHSSSFIGADLARAAGVKRLLLTHHDMTYSDQDLLNIQQTTIEYQKQDTTRPTCEVLVAYEGLTLDLTPPGMVGLQILADREAAILTPTSIFDEQGVNQLELQLARLRESDRAGSSVIDLSQVESLTTASLKALVSLHREGKGKHSTTVLASPSPHVRQVIELAGFLDFFAIYPTVEAALAALQTREALNLPGQIIGGRYQIEQKITDDRLGAVLKATDIRLGIPVAIRIFSISFSEKAIERFLRHAQQLIHLRHEHMVDVLDCGQAADVAYTVEEFVDGHFLHEVLANKTEPLPAKQALEIGLQITHALEYAHSRGVIHSDLQLKNVTLVTPLSTESGGQKLPIIKVRRFGLGRLEEGGSLLDKPLILLSAHYVAPEQILGQVLDARTDLYALGVILYELFTGHRPFEQGTDQDILNAHLSKLPPPPRELNPRLSRSLEHLILKLLNKNPNERYVNAQQARQILSSLVVDRENETGVIPLILQRQRTLVGRQSQLQKLLVAWEQVINEHSGQLLFITGETGIGKTRLSRELASQVKSGVVLIGHCQEWESAPAYHPFIEILRAYFATVPPEMFDPASSQLLSEVSRLVPEIKDLLPGLPEASPLETQQEQLRLMTSITQFVEQATKVRPWLLIIEDLHWADASSLHLLTYLARYCPTIGLLIVATYRDTDLGINHPLLDTLRSLSRHPTYRILPLKRLNPTEVGEMISDILGQDAPSELVTTIYNHTEGNPVYVEEVTNGLIEDGLIIHKPEGWQFSEMSEIRLPQTVRDAVLYRLTHLNQDTHQLLRQAAILGRTFKFDDLHAISNLSEWEVLERLDVALERQLIHETFGETTLTFSHAEIQQVLYEEMPVLRRRMLHLQAGEALERRMRPDPESVVEQLAHHFKQAGKFEKSIIYSIEAARQAEMIYASQTALSWYKNVLEMISQLDEKKISEFRMFRLLAFEALGEILIAQGQYDHALAYYEAAISVVEADKNAADWKNRLADLCQKTARVYKKRADFSTALEWIKRGLSYLDESHPTIEVAKLQLLGAEVYHRQGNNAIAITWCQRGLAADLHDETREERQTTARAYYLLGEIYRGLGDVNRSIELCQQSVQAYNELNDLAGLSRAYIGLANAYFEQASWDKAADVLQTSLIMKQEIGDVVDQGRVANNLANIYVNWGDYVQAMELYQQSLEIWQRIGSPYFEMAVLSNLAKVHLAQKEWTKAEECLRQAETISTEVNSERLLPEMERRWARLYLHTNRFDQAMTHIRQSIEAAVAIKDPYEQGVAYRVLGKIHLAQNELELAEVALGQSLQLVTNLASLYEIARTKLALVNLNIRLNRADPDGYLPQIIETFEKLGAAPDLSEALALKQKLTMPL